MPSRLEILELLSFHSNCNSSVKKIRGMSNCKKLKTTVVYAHKNTILSHPYSTFVPGEIPVMDFSSISTYVTSNCCSEAISCRNCTKLKLASFKEVVCKHRTKDHNKFWLCFFEYVIALQTHKSKVHR